MLITEELKGAVCVHDNRRHPQVEWDPTRSISNYSLTAAPLSLLTVNDPDAM